ncbi:alkaline phosphatase [Rossellomorea vietnamensis]|uniref:Alkaline phosphatase n=1 Tax=Rossellomorea vietnamensis TaxID=218284 RepID=A0A6I6USU2_9BACI|nr:alkaline phosphatase [Rossellomorea vietnamensis]QHE63029.1 alkaline phosphatase [Rossellomorea vietnamensis]
MKKSMKKILPLAVVSSLALGSVIGLNQDDMEAKAKESKNGKAKNVIFMIGDGMGVPYTTALRYMNDNPDTMEMEKTAFDPYLVGLQTTYPEDEKENVTDSAAAATAMSGGVKTYNNAIAVDNDKSDVKTVLEQAKENNMSTGIVSTSEITHATPASYGAHEESRKSEDAIANDYYDEMINGKHKIDVMLGGGTDFFERDDRNIAEQFKKDGYSYVKSADELKKDKNDQILGLFAESGMDKMIDRDEKQPSLADMTTAALDRLKGDKDGFFLMVEGSQIDWAGHDNDVVGAMSEMRDFEQAFEKVRDFAKENGETLVIVTADHSTGGISIGSDGEYNWDPAPIQAAKHTPDYMAEQIVNGASVEETLANNIDLELTPEDIASVKTAAEKGDQTEIDNAIEKIFDTRSGTGWTTDGHTGDDVPVYAFGPQKEKFAGLIDNTDQANQIFELLKNKGKIKDKK